MCGSLILSLDCIFHSKVKLFVLEVESSTLNLWKIFGFELVESLGFDLIEGLQLVVS